MARLTLQIFALIALMGAGIPVYADLAPDGAPVDANSSMHPFRYWLDTPFTELRFQILTGGVTFVDDAWGPGLIIRTPSSGWTQTSSGAQQLTASGLALKELRFWLHFSSEVEDPLTFQLESYSGMQPLERIRASWTPNDSSLMGGAWTDVKVPVPEASTLLLRGGWVLGLAALIVTRRRKAPGL